MKFTKMSGHGNDFIVIDNREDILSEKELVPFTKKVCVRALSVGADGVILIENSTISDFKMRIINSDGSEVNMCGNGARCAVLFAVDRGIVNSHKVSFETLAGILYGEYKDNGIKVQLTKPYDLSLNNPPILFENEKIQYSFINTGVPHVCVLVDDLESIAVNKLGSFIRYHDRFQPSGTNANFISIQNEHELSIRTYERGVEAETLACGTGTVASALISGLRGKVISPVNVMTRSGEYLKVSWDSLEIDSLNVFLEGKVRYIYEGILSYEIM